MKLGDIGNAAELPADRKAPEPKPHFKAYPLNPATDEESKTAELLLKNLSKLWIPQAI
jgi:hypothetical protein